MAHMHAPLHTPGGAPLENFHQLPHGPRPHRSVPLHGASRHALPQQVIDGTMVKIYAWYDNEYGYSARLVDLAAIVAKRM